MLTFADLFTSIDELYARIPGAEASLENARRMIREEVSELIDELHEERSTQAALEEAVDLIYVVLVSVKAKGGTLQMLEDALLEVILKNARKTPETHEWRENKIQRRVMQLSGISG